jgi:hypothetical protein
VGDPANGTAYRNAKPGDVIQLFATGLVPTAAGVLATPQTVNGVTVTIGGATVTVDYVGLAYAGEFQINFTVPQQFSTRASGNYPVTIAVNGVSSPTAINSDPPGPVVIPIQTGNAPPPTSVTFYVAPNGNDASSGTLAAPFATFERARAAGQALNKTGLTQISVRFRGATYYLSAAQQFTAAVIRISALLMRATPAKPR